MARNSGLYLSQTHFVLKPNKNWGKSDVLGKPEFCPSPVKSVPKTTNLSHAVSLGMLYYEMVNEFTNPVLQVFYSAPNEIHIFGIFIVDTNKLLETFGGPPQLITLTSKIFNKTNGQEITNAFDISEAFSTNSIANII